MKRPLPTWVRALAAIAVLLLSAEAWARVGGGQSYSGGSSGSSSSGGGGGDLDAGVIYLLIRLCIEFPAIGIPLTVVVVGFVIYSKTRGNSGGTTWSTHHGPRGQRPPPPGRNQPAPSGSAVPTLTRIDPNFSLPLFLDWVNLVYVRGQEARGTGDKERLVEHFSDAAQATLLAGREGLKSVKNVIVGSTRIASLRPDADRIYVEVAFESNLTETRAQDTTLLLVERWVFSRKAGVLSPGPDKLRTLGCPSCGSTTDPKSDGRCPNCDTLRTGGESQWQVTRIQLLSKKAITPPELGSGGIEAGTSSLTRFDPDLSVERRKFDDRNPGHDWTAFRARVEEVFRRLQAAWDAGRWEDARPYETDALFQQHRFWIERYKLFGLRNRLDDIAIKNVETVRISTDAFYESITVRLHASMKDWTIRTSDEKVMGGSADKPRSFTEYWTFIRTVGTKHKETFDPANCPSCAAPLDKVSMAGVCGYCEAKIVTGDFDWILSRIEQDESYEGG